MPPGSTPASRGTPSWDRSRCEIFEGSSLKPGRFTVAAEVHESDDGGFLAELVLPDGRRVSLGLRAPGHRSAPGV